MATIKVSPETLREKARLIRTLLEENKGNHHYLWTQISGQVTALPRNIAASHYYLNTPWNTAVEDHYDNYHQVGSSMATAADAYEQENQDVKGLFDSF
jgi:hypothetical protein